MVKFASQPDFQLSSVTTYSLDNPWWRVKGLNPDEINWGRPLFIEYWYAIKSEVRREIFPPTFTVHPKPRYYSNKDLYDGEERIYPSFTQVYLEHSDPTEYIFALSVFNSWEKWEKLANNAAIIPIVEEARRQLGMKLKALGVRKNLELAEAGHQKAAEWTIKEGWNPEAPTNQKLSRGRKSKQQLEAEAKNQVDDLAEAMSRVSPFLKVVNNE